MFRLVLPLTLALAMAVPCGSAFAETTAVTLQSAGDMAETQKPADGDKPSAGFFGKTGGIGLGPVAAGLGVSSAACALLWRAYAKGDEDADVG